MGQTSAQPRDQADVMQEKNNERHCTTAPETVCCVICQKSAVKSCLDCVSSFCEDDIKKHLTNTTLKKHKLVAPTKDLEKEDCEEHTREETVYLKQIETSKEEKKTPETATPEEHLTVISLTEESDSSWSAELTWNFQHAAEHSPHSFQITYQCAGLEPKTISSEKCNTVIEGLRPDTKYTADVCATFPDSRKSANLSTIFYTRELRIVLLGKTGTGKSSTGNTILQEEAFRALTGSISVTDRCIAKSKTIRGRQIKVVETPGLFDTHRPEEQVNSEIAACITECCPGPHAFIVLLKVERYTEHEQDVVEKVKQLFGDELLKHTVILFTQGDQLKEGQTIKDFVEGQNVEGIEGRNHLKELVDACGGRYHVIDNKYWNQEHEHRSNNMQVERLLNTIEKMVRDKGGCYTNELLEFLESQIQIEMHEIWNKDKNLSRNHVRETARKRVDDKILSKEIAGLTTEILISFLCLPYTAIAGALVGTTAMYVRAYKIITNDQDCPMKEATGHIKRQLTELPRVHETELAKAKNVGEAIWLSAKHTFKKQGLIVKYVYEIFEIDKCKPEDSGNEE